MKAIVCVVAVTLPAVISPATVGKGAAVTPVLLVPTCSCSCPPTVRSMWVFGATEVCSLSGADQPCFVFTSETDGDAEPSPGTCVIGATPPDVSPCPGPDKKCTYPAWSITVRFADCAGSGPNACGNGPFKVIDPFGQEVSDKLEAGDHLSVPFPIGALPCRSVADYRLTVYDAGGVKKAEYNVRAKCDKCECDPSEYSPPAPQ